MSWNPSLEAACPLAGSEDSIEKLIVPRARDLGGFEVRRALPAPKRQMVGPFIFFDPGGTCGIHHGQGRGCASAYRSRHRHLSLPRRIPASGQFGIEPDDPPSAVNWMVAGQGVTHSERSSEAARKAPYSLFGIQTWIALPDKAEDITPAFEH